MHITRYSIALSLLLLGAGSARSQESHTEVCFEFRVNSMSVDSLYGDNAERMRELRAFLRNAREDNTLGITKVAFRGAASPEGSSGLNHNLAHGRLSTIEKIVRKEIYLPDSIITRDDGYIPWEHLKSQVEASDIRCKDEIIAILNCEPEYAEYRSGAKIDKRVLKLQNLDGGSVWRQISGLFFSSMRHACVVFTTHKKTMPAPPHPIQETINEKAKLKPAEENEEHKVWTRHLYLKTNAIGWGMAISNIAAEIDLARHWSFTIPVYWSAWNYFKSTLKFRTLSLQPEIRYWHYPNNDGLFAGAHFGLTWYNFATNGKYRTQDHNGHSPAVGGGIAAGYRLPISRDKRWKLEFSLGAGAYALHYDKFHNYNDGLLVETKKKTWLGLDQAAISFAYTFGLGGKKGGGQ